MIFRCWCTTEKVLFTNNTNRNFFNGVLAEIDFNKSIPTALIVGAEHNGVSKSIIEKSDFILKIPMSGDVSSLNVSVATGITLYKLKFQ